MKHVSLVICSLLAMVPFVRLDAEKKLPKFLDGKVEKASASERSNLNGFETGPTMKNEPKEKQ